MYKRQVTVCKAYSSAVGAGAFVSEIFGEEADELRKRGGDGGEFGATTGRQMCIRDRRQIEFAKMYLTNVVTGKRYIKKLVQDGVVDGWDDPRLVSIAALRSCLLYTSRCV